MDYIGKSCLYPTDFNPNERDFEGILLGMERSRVWPGDRGTWEWGSSAVPVGLQVAGEAHGCVDKAPHQAQGMRAAPLAPARDR